MSYIVEDPKKTISSLETKNRQKKQFCANLRLGSSFFEQKLQRNFL